MLVDNLIEKFQPGSMTIPELRSYLVKNSKLCARERRTVEYKVRKLAAGLNLFKKIQSDRNGQLSTLVPEEAEWRKLILGNPRDQAQWYLDSCPEVGTPEYNIFKRLCRAFGVGGNEFYYWLRKLG